MISMVEKIKNIVAHKICMSYNRIEFTLHIRQNQNQTFYMHVSPPIRKPNEIESIDGTNWWIECESGRHLSIS